MKRIYLIGYMGAGKTTMGRKLAAQLSLDFIDVDFFIENKYNKTISQIFEEYGETKFREIENKAIAEISTFENVIISTGGGTPCFFNNMDLMNNAGLTVYLQASPISLSKRLIISKTKRPLIKDKTEEELVQFIDFNLTQRSQHYNKAKIIYNTDQILDKTDVDVYVAPLVEEINKHFDTK